MEERLQKVLARAGVASRRHAEELIAAGRVRVDGRIVTELGVKIDPRAARVEVDGKRLAPEELVYLVMHKPRGVMCTLDDPQGRHTVAELLTHVKERVTPVGRLDFHTSGVLLLTNDGEFAAKLTHPSGGAEKIYVVKVGAVLDEGGLARWAQPIEIDGRMTRAANVRLLRHEGDKTWLELRIHEGRNRQVRRIGEALGQRVMRLARLSFAGIDAEGLKPGQWRHLSMDELRGMKKVFGVPRKLHAPPSLEPSRLPRWIVDGRVQTRPEDALPRDEHDVGAGSFEGVRRAPPARTEGGAARGVVERGERGATAGRGAKAASERRGAPAGRGAAASTSERRGAPAGRGAAASTSERRGAAPGRGAATSTSERRGAAAGRAAATSTSSERRGAPSGRGTATSTSERRGAARAAPAERGAARGRPGAVESRGGRRAARTAPSAGAAESDVGTRRRR